MAKIYIWYIGEIMIYNSSNSSNSKYSNKWLIITIAIITAAVAVGVVGYLAIAKPTLIEGGGSAMPEIAPLDDLVKDSSLIVIGKVIEEKPSKKDFDSDNASVEFVYTEYVIKVDRYLYSKDVNDDSITIKVLGGKVDFMEFVFEDSPSLKVGDRVLLLLDNRPDGFYEGSWYVVGWRQGAYNLVDGMAYNQFSRERDMPEDKLVDTILRILASDEK